MVERKDFKENNIELAKPEFEQPFYQSPDLNFSNVRDKIYTMTISLPADEGQDVNKINGVYLIVPFKSVITKAQLAMESPSSESSRTLHLEKLTSGVSKNSGTNLFSSNWDVSSGVASDTVFDASLVTNATTRTFNAGDRIGIVRNNTLTNIFGITITVTFKIL